MIRSSGKRELVFFIILYTVFYLFTASVVPYIGVKPAIPGADVLAFSTVRPDIMLALVICTGILANGKRKVVLGIIFGFIVDVTCSVPMLSSLTYCLCGLYASKLSRIVFGRGVVNTVFAAVPLLLIRAAVSIFYLLGTWHNIGFFEILAGAVIPEYLCNLVAVAVVYLITVALMRLFRIEKSV